MIPVWVAERRKNMTLIKEVFDKVEIEKLLVVKPTPADRVKGGKKYVYNRLDVTVEDPLGPYYVLPSLTFERFLELYDRYESVLSVAEKLCSMYEVELEVRLSNLKEMLRDRYLRKKWLEENKERVRNYDAEMEATEFGISVITEDIKFHIEKLNTIKRLCGEYVFKPRFEEETDFS